MCSGRIDDAREDAQDAMTDPTRRFTDRVEDYARYRPAYPAAVGVTLQRETDLGPTGVVADVGSGTGISSRMLLDCGWTVYAIEPNEAMRAEAERRFLEHPRFRSVPGQAEQTGLPDASVDLILAAQAFHWFDPAVTRGEFRRILRPNGLVALLWNNRQTKRAPFLEAYERFLVDHGTDYTTVDHRHVTEERIREFLPSQYRLFVFPHEQVLDWDGLRGRILSSSYMPGADHPRHAVMLVALRALFDAHHEGGMVRIEYHTELHLGGLGSPKVA